MPLDPKEFDDALGNLPSGDEFANPGIEWDDSELIGKIREPADPDSGMDRSVTEYLVKIPINMGGSEDPMDALSIVQNIFYEEIDGIDILADTLPVDPYTEFHEIGMAWVTQEGEKFILYLVLNSYAMSEYEINRDLNIQDMDSTDVRFVAPKTSAEMVSAFSK